MKNIFLISFCLILTLSVRSQTVVKMQREGGVSVIPCKVNCLNLSFIFDTGASDVSISLTEAIYMVKNGLLSRSDILGTAKYQNANGQVSEAYVINLREIEFAGLKLYNVRASIVNNLNAPLLLGQSAIARLGQFQLDLDKNTLTILKGNGKYDYTDYIQNYESTEVINAEANGKPTDAPIEVIVTDFNNNSQPNVMVVFQSSATKKEYIGYTNDYGRLSLRLPVGSFYQIILLGNKDFTNSSFEIPRPTGNSYYKNPFKIEIQFEMPKARTVMMRFFTEINKIEIQAKSYDAVGGLISVLKSDPKEKIEIWGYSDKKEINNYDLALQRATSLKNYFVSKGVKSYQIEVKSLGVEARPTDAYQFKNWKDSRVEIMSVY